MVDSPLWVCRHVHSQVPLGCSTESLAAPFATTFAINVYGSLGIIVSILLVGLVSGAVLFRGPLVPAGRLWRAFCIKWFGIVIFLQVSGAAVASSSCPSSSSSFIFLLWLFLRSHLHLHLLRHHRHMVPRSFSTLPSAKSSYKPFAPASP